MSAKGWSGAMTPGAAEAEGPRWRRWAVLLCVAAFVVRALFLLVAARAYFGRANVHVDGDTAAWATAFVNLIDRGELTTNPDSPFGPFGRMPAYSFAIGFFYLLAGRRLDIAYPLLAWAQILADSACVYLMYRIAAKAYGDPRCGVAAAALYAFYPFVIVWTPVAYSEALAMAVMIAGVHFFVRSDAPRSSAAAGALIGLSSLFRPQMLVLAAVMAAWLTLHRRPRRLLAFVLGVTLVFGAWPARNYLSYRRVVLTQDLRAFKNWSPDVLAFLQYMYSVKAEWEPQFTQMVTLRKVEFPAASYAVPGDREKLERAVGLAQTCGSGFTYWKTSVRPPLTSANCNDEVARLFDELRRTQYRENPWNAYVKVPLQNLKKAVFKQQLVDSGGALRRLASHLFLYRTLLIAIGVAAAGVILRRRLDPTGVTWIALAYFAGWYVLLCAGTIPQLRNIEMRYLLPADILLLVPAAFLAARAFLAFDPPHSQDRLPDPP